MKSTTAIAQHQIEMQFKQGGPLYEEFSAYYARLRVTQTAAESRSDLLALADWLREGVEQRIEEIVQADNV